MGLDSESCSRSSRSVVTLTQKRQTRLYFGDGAKSELDMMSKSGEPLRPLSEFILQQQSSVRALGARELWDLTLERDQYRLAYNEKWNATATGVDDDGRPLGIVDAILCPAGPGAAPPVDCARYWAYTSQWNLLDYSASIFPVRAIACSSRFVTSRD